MPIVEDALIVAGGLGTRMYPVSAFSSKESLPLIDVPVLIHLAHEAKAAGVKRIHIISSPSKDLSPLLRDIQDLHLNRPELDKSLFSSFSDVEVKVHLQQQQLGLGDAISCALDDISGPFLVLLGEITAVNDNLDDSPDLMNTSPYGDGWIIKMKLDDTSGLSSLMDASGYKAEIGE